MTRIPIASLCLVVFAAAPMAAASDPDPLAASLRRINAQCPRSYPDEVTQQPMASDIDALSTAELMTMIGSWNPALRQAAARGLATRGNKVVPSLTDAARSDSADRRAGAATALTGLIRHQLRNPQEVHPDLERGEAHAKIRASFAGHVRLFVELTEDKSVAVRRAAMSALISLQPDTPDAKRAMLALCSDPDDYIASMAAISFEKHFSPKGVAPDELQAGLSEAMASPLPRGKGHTIRVIMQLDEEAQRAFIPLLLEHLDWRPMRDTMFGASGQAEAIRLLTKLRVKELIPRLPKLMNKPMRGPGLFEPCVESIRAFGKDAKVIQPELQAYLKQTEASYAKARGRSKDGLRRKLSKLREVVKHVEAL